MLRTALPFALLASALAWSASDSQRPVRFEVASIKPHRSDDLVGARYLGSQRGRLSIRNSALRSIILLAFGVDGYPEGRIFEALQRAGLRLKRAKLPVDVVVIDRAERPTPN